MYLNHSDRKHDVFVFQQWESRIIIKHCTTHIIAWQIILMSKWPTFHLALKLDSQRLHVIPWQSYLMPDKWQLWRNNGRGKALPTYISWAEVLSKHLRKCTVTHNNVHHIPLWILEFIRMRKSCVIKTLIKSITYTNLLPKMHLVHIEIFLLTWIYRGHLYSIYIDLQTYILPNKKVVPLDKCNYQALSHFNKGI